MAPRPRLLVALCMVLLLAGAAGVVTHRSAPTRRGAVSSSALPGPAARGGASTRPGGLFASPGASTNSGPPGPSTPVLEAGLITPTDMGGYYRTVPSVGAALLASAPCLASLGPGPFQSGRAVTALLGPDEHSVPTLVEEVASYPGGAARSRYGASVAAVDACPALSFDFEGQPVTSRLSASTIPPVADADRVWSGSFRAEGARFTVQLGVILDRDRLLTVLWIDSVPSSDPIMGGFTSTISLAIGKLA